MSIFAFTCSFTYIIMPFFNHRAYLDIIDLTSEPSGSEEEVDLPQAVVTSTAERG